jgi:hypothetical protein
MIQKFECVKSIRLQIPYSDYQIQYLEYKHQIYIELIRIPDTSTFLLQFDAYIELLEDLTYSEDVINYITNNEIGIYYNYEVLDYRYGPCLSNSNWIRIYFNNISTQLLLEHI